MTLLFHERMGKIVKAEEKIGGDSSGWEVCALGAGTEMECRTRELGKGEKVRLTRYQ